MATGANLTVDFLKIVAIDAIAMIFYNIATIFGGCNMQSMV